jgi:hypothetical protein
MDDQIHTLRNAIIGEIFLALGFSKTGFAFRTFGWIFHKPAERLSSLCVTTDRMVETDGFPQAASWILRTWCSRVTSLGTETIPTSGPLLVLSNHAGTYDTFVITSHVARQDLKLIGSDVPFLKYLPNASQHIIFLSDRTQDRMAAARLGMRHLQSGGALLLYGTGLIDPDPEVYTDAEAWIEKWLPSIDLFLRNTPNLKVVISIVSGVVAKRWARHPITWLKRVDWQKRRISEFSQVIQQLLSPGRFYLQPHNSFSEPFTLDDLRADNSHDRLLPAVIIRGKNQLYRHMAWLENLHGR